MKRVLVLPGGGIRGYIQALAVADIENRTGKPASELFDLIVGTSTGGILALGLAAGFPASTIVQFYEKDGPNIFSRSWFQRIFKKHGLRDPKYSAENLREALLKRFSNRVLGRAQTRVLVTAYNWTRGEEVLFKSWSNNFGGNTLVDVAMATSSAPTYFPPHRFNGGDYMVDGGVFANNPAAIAAVEAQKLFSDDHVKLLVIENGHGNPEAPRDPSGFGLIEWAPHIVGVMMDSGYDVSTYLAGRLLSNGHSMKSIWPPAMGVAMDDASEGAFRTMRTGYANMAKAFMGDYFFGWLGD